MSYKATPIQILYEVASKKQLTPRYDLIYNGTDDNVRVFKFVVDLGEINGFGSGGSKKEAKHDAACSVLKKMGYNEYVDRSGIENVTRKIDDFSPYSGVIKDNFVGQLHYLCDLNGLEHPEYTLLKSGVVHNKFFFLLQCTLSHFSEFACSGTKKQTKHIVAKKMIDRLYATIGGFLVPINNNDKDNSDNGTKHQLKLGMKLSEYHLFLNIGEFQNTPLNTLNYIKNKDLDWIINCPSPEELLRDILLELNFVQTIKVIKHNENNVINEKCSLNGGKNDLGGDSNEKFFLCKTLCEEKVKNESSVNVVDPKAEMISVILTINNGFSPQVFIGFSSAYEHALRKANLNAVMFYFFMSKSVK